MSDLINITISEAREGLKAKKFSAAELTRAHLSQVEKTRDLNAYIVETPEIALKQAAESDKKIAAGQGGLLEGVPIGVKDLYCTKGVHSQSCSKILKDFKPEYESTVTTNMFAQGAVMIGKTNMDEFAMGSANLTSCYGVVKNPWDKKLVAGGSSGGSAAAVSAWLCAAATATAVVSDPPRPRVV